MAKAKQAMKQGRGDKMENYATYSEHKASHLKAIDALKVMKQLEQDVIRLKKQGKVKTQTETISNGTRTTYKRTRSGRYD